MFRAHYQTSGQYITRFNRRYSVSYLQSGFSCSSNYKYIYIYQKAVILFNLNNVHHLLKLQVDLDFNPQVFKRTPSSRLPLGLRSRIPPPSFGVQHNLPLIVVILFLFDLQLPNIILYLIIRPQFCIFSYLTKH
jgi:hypothetical protein